MSRATCPLFSLCLLYRLIVIADKDTVYKSFPIPLINRLEKHYIVTATCIQQKDQKLVQLLKQWAQDFAHVPDTRWVISYYLLFLV